MVGLPVHWPREGKRPPSSGSTSNALREEIAQLEAQKAKLHEEAAKEKTAALAAAAKAQQEVTVFEEPEAVQKAGLEAEASAKASQEAECKENQSAWMLEVKALKQQKSQLEEEIGAAETQANGSSRGRGRGA